MTEFEWRAGLDPQPMLNALRGRASDRKLRLFACACCRRIWDRLPDPGSRAAVECAERFADGAASLEELRTAGARARMVSLARKWARPDDPSQYTVLAPVDATYPAGHSAAASVVADAAWWALGADRDGRLLLAEHAALAGLLREIVGDPFRAPAFDPRWRTADVTGLARAVYEERAFDRLPLLADALLDAGCEDEWVIGHCRSEGPHARGCWAVDLVLGKE